MSAPSDAGHTSARAKAVRQIERMMTENRWQHGMHRAIAKRYGVKPKTASDWATEAGVRVKAVLDRYWVTQKFAQTVAELERAAYQAEMEGHRRAQIVALKALGQLLQRVVADDSGTVSEALQATRERLLAAGWTPPTTLPGLPRPASSFLAENVLEQSTDNQGSDERNDETSHLVTMTRKPEK